MSNQRGAVLAMVAVSMVMLLAVTGLALDSGRAFVRQTRLARAVDASVLTGARTLRAGKREARLQALASMAANGFPDGVGSIQLAPKFGTNGLGEQTVTMTATQPMPTILMRVLGRDEVTVAATATAAVPPVDMVLVLDQSGSLNAANAWDDVQNASWNFVRQFDESLDQVGLVSFQIRGTNRFSMNSPFKGAIRNVIFHSGMKSAGDTNAQEALRLALQQFQGPAPRARSAKVVVFFTDGRPTAFRANILGSDRMMAVFKEQKGFLRGYFNDPDNLPTDEIARPPDPWKADGCWREASCGPWDEKSVRRAARELSIAMADRIRDEGIFIYSIGLGNPASSDPLLVPDLDYLRLIANEDGRADPDQPAGKAFFAPSAVQLNDVFNLLAQDLFVRLSK
ncbi:MAG: VWA domain-containing protein [Gemmatimonadota bacterium]